MIEYFYIVGLLFMPALLIELFMRKNKVIDERKEIENLINNPFNTVDFFKKRLGKLILGILLYLWIGYGIGSSEQTGWFLSLATIFVIGAQLPYLIKDSNKKYFIEVASVGMGIMIMGFIIYRHFYISTP